MKKFNPVVAGKRIFLSRADLRWSQRKLAREVDTNQSTISQMEHGKLSSPDIDLIFAIADKLDVSPAYLLCLTDNPLGLGDSSPDIETQEVLSMLNRLSPEQKETVLTMIRGLVQPRVPLTHTGGSEPAQTSFMVGNTQEA